MKLGMLKHVIGYTAVIVLVGAGTAQALPGKNTVDSKDIINGQVKRADLAAAAVNSVKVADGTLTGADLAANTVKGADVDENSLDLGSAGCKLGLVHSFTYLDSNAIGTTWEQVGGHNCSGGQILARNPSPGTFEVRFVGDPATLGIAQPVSGYNSIGVSKSGDIFEISQRNMDGTLVDNHMSVMTY